jgi:DNA polymerase-3 subunit epsilon
VNPDREVDEGAFRVHGISTSFLKDKPRFQAILSQFISFIDKSELIIHNASFDLGFLNAELALLNYPKRIHDHCSVLDTLVMAREKHPGQRNSLDALCKRYHVDNSNRQMHGALLDAELLAFVYLAMTGGQTELFMQHEASRTELQQDTDHPIESLSSRSPVYSATEDELARHHHFLAIHRFD